MGIGAVRFARVLGHPLPARFIELGEMRLLLGVEDAKLVVAA
jgi:hypothetical protein